MTSLYVIYWSISTVLIVSFSRTDVTATASSNKRDCIHIMTDSSLTPKQSSSGAYGEQNWSQYVGGRNRADETKSVLIDTDDDVEIKPEMTSLSKSSGGNVRRKRGAIKLCAAATTTEKRRWGQLSPRAWGKRQVGSAVRLEARPELVERVDKSLSDSEVFVPVMTSSGLQQPIKFNQLGDGTIASSPSDLDDFITADGVSGSGNYATSLRKYVALLNLIHGSHLSKRRWGNDSPRMWGTREIVDENRRRLAESQVRDSGKLKRKWGATAARVWGKRAADLEEDDKVKWEEAFDIKDNKRKWGQQTARAWGKRGEVPDSKLLLLGDDLENVLLKEDIMLDENKRKWGEQSARIWGKRAEDEMEEKRKWGETSARIWGKRERAGTTVM